MKKPRLLLLLLLTSFLPLSAQETVNVAFTASTESGLYCPFTSVSVTNVTRGWTENLVYPDTVLVLTNTVNVAEHIGRAFCLGDAYPNPFMGETQALLELSEKCDVLLQVVRLDGSEVASQTHCLDAGTYRLRVSLSVPQLAFLSVTTGYGRQVTKLVHAGDGAADAIEVDYVSSETKSFGKDEPARLDATGEFELGDVMRYEAQLVDGGVTAYSIAVTQPQNGDEVITLRFALDCPTVTTSEATVITHISAICGGNVIDAGGLMVTARGVCWSTTPNPTMSDSHTTNGMGTGEFLSQLLDLSVETTYYVRAYATNLLCTSYGDEVDFTTLPIPDYNITVTAIPSNGGTVGGGGVYQEGDTCMVSANANAGFEFAYWMEKGSVVSTDANYTFTVTGNRDLEAHFTQQTYTISVSANPSNGGTVSGGGTYTYGQWCTVHANANNGYNFTNWTENGNVVSTNANYTFTVTGNRSLEAHFTPTYTISVSANPSNGGTVSGGGTYTYGQWCTVHANANNGYNFTNWTENGNVVSTDANYPFQVTNSRVLVAHFAETPQIPVGAIDGLFTVDSAGNQVYFSQGNLQYIGSASTPYWKFAENQWEFFGASTNQISPSQTVDRDLFGWGTSGWHDSSDPYNVNYQPWSTSDPGAGSGSGINPDYNYYGYGPSTNMSSPNLTDGSANYDWGIYNPISNGGNQPNLWRILTREEWNWVLNIRSTISGKRYAKAQITGAGNGIVYGVILFPDNWSTSTYDPNCPNQSEVSFSSNVISLDQWNTMQNAGAVFLPAASGRRGTFFIASEEFGGYWTASYSSAYGAHSVTFHENDPYYMLDPSQHSDRCYGHSVRLVAPAGN
ncbi:MAG: hypothetical protein IJP44_06275 [Bacteroidales bacterium]|nr:hypothetical protein [Bacteroidales bacterium]